KFILDNWRIVKLGTTQAQRRLFFNLRKERDKLQRAGIEVNAYEVARALDVRENDVVEMERRLAAPDASLDASVAGENQITADATARPDVCFEAVEFKHQLHQAIERFMVTLDARDRELMNGRLLCEKPATLEEIGRRFGVSRERARQLEERLKGRLRAHLEI